MALNDYYVYVYIDPRNYEEFYYGKGLGSRKSAHLTDSADSPKTKRIAAIKGAGMQPIVRVIARGLTEEQALLVEATLLWKLGKFTTNQVGGHFRDKFRPHDSLHLELDGFDYQSSLYYFNVGDGPHRSWEDCLSFGIISAGQGRRWRDAICGFNVGDIFAAYLRGRGFVGIGRVDERARMARDITIGDQQLLALCPRMIENSNSVEKSEYVARVSWLKSVPRGEAKMKRKAGIYTTTHVRASLIGQPATVQFLAGAFQLNFRDILT